MPNLLNLRCFNLVIVKILHKVLRAQLKEISALLFNTQIKHEIMHFIDGIRALKNPTCNKYIYLALYYNCQKKGQSMYLLKETDNLLYLSVVYEKNWVKE